MKFSKKKQGFTLIELLVVVAIIGVLATIVLSSLSKARDRAKDVKRIAQARTLQTALETYYLDHGSYPNPAGTANFISNCGWDHTGPGTEWERWDNLMTALAPYSSKIQLEQMGTWPACTYYFTTSYFPCAHKPFAGYVILVGAESEFPNLKKWSRTDSQRYCMYPI